MSVQVENEICDLLQEMGTHPERGLPQCEAEERLLKHGRNELVETTRKSAFAMFSSQFKDIMVLVLIAAGIISAATGDAKDTIVIAAVVILNAIMGFVQEYRAENALAALKRLAVPNAKVIRDGRLVDVPAHNLVPGDLVRVQAGDLIPCDGRLTEAVNLAIEEAALTGESVPVEKDALIPSDPDAPLGDRKSEVFMGTTITQGRGTFLATCTGMSTELGKIAKMIEENPARETPLQKRLSQLGMWLAIGALIICAVVLVSGLLQGRDFKTMLLASISLAVAAIPESLPAVITISLALGAQRMVHRNALIRKLPAAETLGCVTTICSDKTGTLTQNKMRVDSIYAGGHLVRRNTNGFIAIGRELLDGELSQTGDKSLQKFLEAVSLCNDGRLQADHEGNVEAVGDPTETSLLIAAQHTGMDPNSMQVLFPRIAEVPFDSVRKRMTTVHQSANGTIQSFTKGALDMILPRCLWELHDGVLTELNESCIERIRTIAEEFASRGDRIIAGASRAHSIVPADINADALECDMIFLGFAGISDPPRPEVAEAVAKCKSAGIQVNMITGDHMLTAAAIGNDLGIITQGDSVCSGAELDRLNKHTLAEKIENCRIYARVSPENKVQIVEALQSGGHIVAMTGDGVNDAPSLKQADIGIAMGITGTDVSREASDMVLTDDNFATIVAAVEEGRTIYDNIRKFVRYTLATNFGEVLTMFCGMLIGLPLPLLPIQILWINLVTDGLPALALGMEKSEGNVMNRPPRDPKESLFARGLWQHILWVGAFMAIATLGLFMLEIPKHGIDYARTMSFFTLATFQLFHVVAIRRERDSAFKSNMFANPFLAVAVIGTFILQTLIISSTWAAHIFKGVPVAPIDILLCTVVASTILFAVEFEKRYLRRNHKWE
ncbi:MAG: cation-translocating P-type ATPase [Armatimonadota bacterium]